MTDPCEKHPADIVNESREKCGTCQPNKPIGFTSQRNYVSVAGGVQTKGSGYGWSTDSQAEADQMAIDRAMEEARTLMGIKLRPLGITSRMYRSARKLWSRFSMAWKAFHRVAPLCKTKWHGIMEKKPWEYNISAVIPHLDTLDSLIICIETLRMQTERPYIMVIDTGSNPDVCDQLESLRADDLEIHYIRCGAYSHSSEPVTAALDLAHSLCRSKFIYHTHSDVFLRRAEFLSEILTRCSEANPVVGYRMSPRDWINDEWKTMVGHTCTILHMPTIFRSGAVWSMQKMHHVYHYPWTIGMGWPDTEVGFNSTLSEVGIKPDFIGFDRNFERNVDRNIDHVRSYPGMKMYDELRFSDKEVEMACAINEASMRSVLSRRKIPMPKPAVDQGLVNESCYAASSSSPQLSDS